MSSSASLPLPKILQLRIQPAIPFDKLPTKVAKRKAIAQDVKAQLDARQFKATQGSWVTYQPKDIPVGVANCDTLGDHPKPKTVKELLSAVPTKSCEVCALGGLLMSQFRLNGDCPVEEVDARAERCTESWWGNDSDEVRIDPVTGHTSDGANVFSPFIRKYFSAQQLQLIEVAFELGGGGFNVEDAVDY